MDAKIIRLRPAKNKIFDHFFKVLLSKISRDFLSMKQLGEPKMESSLRNVNIIHCGWNWIEHIENFQKRIKSKGLTELLALYKVFNSCSKVAYVWKTRMLKLTKIFFENFWGPISQLSEIVWPASYFQHPSQFWKYKLYPLREKIVKTSLASNHFVTSSVEWPISKLWSRWNENSMPILWSHKLKS